MKKVPDESERAYRPAVGIMLLNDDDRVFVARRIDTVVEAWQMPQGGIDEGEAPREAALRELEEEIGTAKATILAESRAWLRYDLPAELVGKVWGGRYRGQRQKWFAMRFTGSDTDIDLATEHPEFMDWKWIEPGQLPELIIPFKRQLYRDVLAEFAGIYGAKRSS
ncbi:MAG: RNA pyrophosphohydrolase [Alphaproteobacteria bacterium]|nr:RNA pyrophosphohydrolase [Alphaproteobacteria bacterium]